MIDVAKRSRSSDRLAGLTVSTSFYNKDEVDYLEKPVYKYSTQFAAGGEMSHNNPSITEKPKLLDEEEVFMNGIPPPSSPPRFRM